MPLSSWFLKLVKISLCIAFLFPTANACAGHSGWFYESFSWQGLRSYFGKGDVKQRKFYLAHLDKLIAQERKEPFYYIALSEENIQLWRSFIENGLDYSTLNSDQAKFADRIIAIIMGYEAELDSLKVKAETHPDFFHPKSLQKLIASSSEEAKQILILFKFGRGYGQIHPRTQCPREGGAWYCYGMYVILSPSECEILGRELKRLLQLPSFAEERESLTGFAQALNRASKNGRGLYLHTSD
jgi:hypothetical protein